MKLCVTPHCSLLDALKHELVNSYEVLHKLYLDSLLSSNQLWQQQKKITEYSENIQLSIFWGVLFLPERVATYAL